MEIEKEELEQNQGTQPGFMITVKGRKLLAKLVAGEQLEITRVMVGSGNLGEESPAYFDDLIQPVAQATSTEPVAEDGVVSFIVEYRSDLNGGIQRFVIGVDPQQKILTGISDHFPWDLTVIKLFTVEIIQGTDAWYIFMKQVAKQSHKTSVPQKYIIIKCSVHKIADVTASFRRFVCIAEQNLYRIPVTLIPLRFCPDLRVRKAVSDLFKYRQRFMIILLFVKKHTSFCRIQKCIVSFHN